MQALLFRSRRLGRLKDVSYRNAMTTVSARRWRRAEPGLVDVVEKLSLLPKALELLEIEGIDRDSLLRQLAIPETQFRTITARSPET